MRTRQEIKAIGKERFRSYYWPSVGAIVLVELIFFIISGAAIGPSYVAMLTAILAGDPYAMESGLGVGAGASIASLAMFILDGPLTVGLCSFFVRLILGQEDEIGVGTPFFSAFTGFGRKLGGYLWMLLFTFLWTLLLVIPGIIKSFSYAMTPYILSDCPNVKATDALKLSKLIMRGHKWQLFVFGLSFIGWALLSCLTFGLLPIFYVNPYIQSSLACWYLEVREDALRNGAVTMGQLEGTEPV